MRWCSDASRVARAMGPAGAMATQSSGTSHGPAAAQSLLALETMSGWDGSYEEWAQELNYEHELSYWQDHNAWQEWQEDGAVKEVPGLFYFFTNISIHNVWVLYGFILKNNPGTEELDTERPVPVARPVGPPDEEVLPEAAAGAPKAARENICLEYLVLCQAAKFEFLSACNLAGRAGQEEASTCSRALSAAQAAQEGAQQSH